MRDSLAGDPTAERDDALLHRTLGQRRSSTGRSFFDEVGPEWDALRRVFGDDLLRARATTHLVRAGLRVADIGTGTGILALELAALGLDVIAIDRSEAMLEAARAKWASSAQLGAGSVEFQTGDAHCLSLEAEVVDAAFAHMVLHSLEKPELAVAEMARIVRPAGRVILVDFLAHEHRWMENELGLLWMGFEEDTLVQWMEAAGLEDVSIRRQGPDAKRDLPASFVAAASKPDSTRDV